MNSEVEFSTQAFSKVVMHAMKYPHTMCKGLLLSPKPSVEGENGDEQSKTRIIDAIPISHASQSNYLTPNTEVAFNSVGVFAQEQELVVSGYYQTERYPDPSEPDLFTQKVTEMICETYPNAVLCLVSFGDAMASLSLLQLIDGKWRRKPPSSFKVETDPDIIAENILYTKDKLYRKIVDFDDHFDDISLDWTNASIGQKIDFLISNVC